MILFIAPSISSATDSRQCDPALIAKSAVVVGEGNRDRVEWCIDSSGQKQGRWRIIDMSSNTVMAETIYVNGLAQGNSQTFDSKGNVMTITEYDQGIKKRFYITDYYLRTVFDEQSRKYEAAGKKIRIRLAAGRRIVAEYRTELATVNSNLVALNMFSDAWQVKMCKLTLKNQIKGIDMIIYGSSGEEIWRGEISPSECQLLNPRADD